jgi:SAM-dependent methyltransferase
VGVVLSEDGGGGPGNSERAGVTAWHTEYWISDNDLRDVGFSAYWNDESEEKQKEWYILDGDFSKMEQHLQRTGLPRDIERAVRILQTRYGGRLSGVGLDIAAGNLWAAPYLFRLGSVERLYCLEYSKHRLLTIGPRVLEHYNVANDRIVLALGSFYDIRLADRSLDFVFMSQAFHHADEPERLVSEVARLLRPGGFAIIIGEHVVEPPYPTHLAKWIVSRLIAPGIQRRLLGRSIARRPLRVSAIPKPPTDPIMGDHYYTRREYEQLFSSRFATTRFNTRGSGSQGFLLVKQAACR